MRKYANERSENDLKTVKYAETPQSDKPSLRSTVGDSSSALLLAEEIDFYPGIRFPWGCPGRELLKSY